MINSVNEVLLQTDWNLVAKQKLALLQYINSEEEDSLLVGLVNWIDAIQDAAITSQLLTEHQIFGELDNA